MVTTQYVVQERALDDLETIFKSPNWGEGKVPVISKAREVKSTNFVSNLKDYILIYADTETQKNFMGLQGSYHTVSVTIEVRSDDNEDRFRLVVDEVSRILRVKGNKDPYWAHIIIKGVKDDSDRTRNKWKKFFDVEMTVCVVAP